MTMRRKNSVAETALSYESHVEGKILRVTVHGRYGGTGYDHLFEEIREAVVKTGLRHVICDLRLAIVAVEPLRVNQRMRRICADEIMSLVKTALIVNVRLSNFAYVEEVATLNSLSIRVFTDGVLAEQWLNQPDAQLAVAS